MLSTPYIPQVSDFINAYFVLFLWVCGIYTLGLIKISLNSKRLPIPVQNIIAFYAGISLFYFNFTGILTFYSETFFWAHMLQHVIFISFCVPLISLSRPLPVFLWAFPKDTRIAVGKLIFASDSKIATKLSYLTNPRITLAVYFLTLWLWHIPIFYEAAIANEYVHFLQHAMFILAGFLFWWPVIAPPPARKLLAYPKRMIYLIIAITPAAALGALITFSSGAWYEPYKSLADEIGRQDQTLAGLIMWLPGNLTYLSGFAYSFIKWAQTEGVL